MATAISSARAALERAAGSGTSIPFDYSFRFALSGEPGRRLVSTLKVSIEGAFVAVSIGYGFKPAVTQKKIPLILRAAPTQLGAAAVKLYGVIAQFRQGILALLGVAAPAPLPSTGAPVTLNSITMGDVLRSVIEASAGADSVITSRRLMSALRNGIRINPDVVDRLALSGSMPIDADAQRQLFELAGTPGDVQFLYALFDEGTGREFQSEPILSTAGLGSADGDRPFRQFPMPIRFEPSSSIRMEVTETDREVGDLYVVLHGYKVLGSTMPSTGPAVRPGLRRRR